MTHLIPEYFNYIEASTGFSPFIKSLKDQYTMKGSLSKKQLSCLEETFYRQQKIETLFNQIEFKNSSFIQSLMEQYDEKKWLSDKQIEALDRIIAKQQ